MNYYVLVTTSTWQIFSSLERAKSFLKEYATFDNSLECYICGPFSDGEVIDTSRKIVDDAMKRDEKTPFWSIGNPPLPYK